MRSLLLLLVFTFTAFSSIGKVSASRGEVHIQRDIGSIKVSRDTLVEERDTVITQQLSRVQIILHDDTVIMIGPKSRFSFDRYNDEKSNAEAKMKIHHGVFKAITGEIGKIAPQRFKIKTRTSTIGIRGTHFMGIIEAELEKIACIKGEIIVTIGDKTYSVLAGNMITILKGKVESVELLKFEYQNFRLRLFEDVEEVEKGKLPRLEKKNITKRVDVNDVMQKGSVRSNSIEKDTMLSDEVMIEHTDNLTSRPSIIGGDISNPDNPLQPFDPDL